MIAAEQAADPSSGLKVLFSLDVPFFFLDQLRQLRYCSSCCGILTRSSVGHCTYVSAESIEMRVQAISQT